MITIGLTGGIGMGKSACAQILAARGISVIDTDDLARHVTAPGQPALEEIRAEFGPEVIDSAGSLLRGELARKVFGDPAARLRLESILHPRIRRLWRDQIDAWRSTAVPLAVVVIPLLFETQAERELDTTICVACSATTQQERLLARGWSLQQIDQRLQAQWPVEKKMLHANFVIWTEGNLDLSKAQLDRVLVGRLPPAGTG